MTTHIPALSKPTRYLHWIIAAGMIGLFAAGQYMTRFDAWDVYPIHKSLGMLILLAVIPRVILRIKEGWPTPVGEAPPVQERIAKIVHWALILSTAIMPISGMLMSGAGGNGLHIFGLELLSANPDPDNPMRAIPLNETLSGVGHFAHEIGSKVLAISVVLHVAGALKHHIVDKDATLKRMLGKSSD